jgi:hypothetical protein
MSHICVVDQRNLLRSYMQCSFASNAKCVTFMNMIGMVSPRLKPYLVPLMNVPPSSQPSLFAAITSLSDADLRRLLSTSVTGLWKITHNNRDLYFIYLFSGKQTDRFTENTNLRSFAPTWNRYTCDLFHSVNMFPKIHIVYSNLVQVLSFSFKWSHLFIFWYSDHQSDDTDRCSEHSESRKLANVKL